MDSLFPAKEEVGSAADVQEAISTENGPMIDISRYLQVSGTLETRYLRMLSSLCSLTYRMSILTPHTLYRMHQLRLVTSSRAQEVPRKPDKVQGKAGKAQKEEELFTQEKTEADESLVLVNATAELDNHKSGSSCEPSQENGLSMNNIALVQSGALPSLGPAVLMTRKLGEAAAAAAALGGRAGEVVMTTARAPFAQSVAKLLETAAEEGGQGAELAAAKARAKEEASTSAGCPCEWFVADDPVSHTRYFVIQGTDNLDSWITNVTFDPVVFERPELGVKVHRGVYNAAHALYGRMLPLVQEHLAASPFARVAFTGHSLGGALATVLLLMYKNRGVLPRSAISPAYTFGSAAVFCETGGAILTEFNGTDVTASQEDGATADLLTKLGLSEGAIRNVVMHRDIVPRAFACDYSLVASLLARVSVAFRLHSSLHSARGVLYSFVGRVMVLQPAEDLTFAEEGPLPMLPPGPGLYTLRHPSLMGTHQQQKRIKKAEFDAFDWAAAPQDWEDCVKNTSSPLSPPTLGAAVMAFMDNPHPLSILADPRAYGNDGAISRYHNPDNYTRALGAVLRARRGGLADMADPLGLKRRVSRLVRAGRDAFSRLREELRLVSGEQILIKF